MLYLYGNIVGLLTQVNGRKTTQQGKTKGVKQGCPFSLNMFVLVLHAILETITDALGTYYLSGSCLSLPFILGYVFADVLDIDTQISY